MATKFLLPSHHAFFTIFSKTRIITKPLLSKPSIIRFFCSVSLVHNVIHGPSLYKGTNPSKFNNQPLFKSSPLVIHEFKTDEKPKESIIDEESFSRVFDILALRVPSEECFAFENQLRCHLLNWPRIRNIARVPGDDVEHELKKTFPEKSPLDLVKSFNSCGSTKLENSVNVSRSTGKEKLVMEVETSDSRKRIGKDDAYGIEVVSDIDNEKDDMTGILGDEFEERKWRGPTRLLLLDEKYAAKDVNELPEVIKALFKGVKGNRRFALVTCRLTLFYNYWQMNEILEELLPKGMVVPTAFETVGHIAHLNLKEEHLPYKQIIAQAVLDKNKPKIRTVVNKIDSIQSEYRTMHLELLAGNHSLVTTVIENGSRFHVDLGAVYWNSRLATERQRLVNRFTSSDIVCDVFSGVGPLAVAAAKKVKHVYANDLNPSAVECLEKNCVLNKLKRKITVFNMDGRRFIDYVFTSPKAISITQVVMNLPNDAAEFLDVFRGIYQGRSRYSDTAMPMIHVYGFSKAQDPETDFHQRIKTALLEDIVEVEMHRVRVVAPGKWMLCASFVLPKRVAFAKEKLKTG